MSLALEWVLKAQSRDEPDQWLSVAIDLRNGLQGPSEFNQIMTKPPKDWPRLTYRHLSCMLAAEEQGKNRKTIITILRKTWSRMDCRRRRQYR